MKRIVICSVLLILSVSLSVYSHMKIENVSDDLETRIDAMFEILPDENCPELLAHAEGIGEFWNQEENVLVHFVRHSYIDVVTTSVMRLPSLAKYGDFSGLSAELAVIRRQMEHIRSSEMFAFDKLL